MALSGMLASNQLRTITGTNRLVRFDLLAQTDALRAAFAASLGKPLVVTDGYRSYQSQVTVFTSRYTRTYLAGRPYRVWNDERWYQRPGTAAAAVPGTSNHGWAQALDLGSGVNVSLYSPEYVWMRNHAPAYGWTHPAWARNPGTLEPWHWEAEYVPASSYTPGPTPPTPIPPPGPAPVPEDDMYEDSDRARDQLVSVQVAQTRDIVEWANNNATAAKVAAEAGLSLSQQLLTLVKKLAANDPLLLAMCETINLSITKQTDGLLVLGRSIDGVSRQLADVKARAALATRKQYSGLTTEKASYDELELAYATYEEMAGIRDPLTATVTVEATIPPGQLEEEVKDALVAAAPVLAEAVNDDAYNRMKE